MGDPYGDRGHAPDSVRRWTRSATGPWKSGAERRSTRAFAFLTRTRGSACASSKQHCPHTRPADADREVRTSSGTTTTPKTSCDHFIKASKRNGIDVFRVFDALNDIRNVKDSAEAINECGGHFEGAISYTLSPVHTLDSYVEYGHAAQGAAAPRPLPSRTWRACSRPYRTERLVKASQRRGRPAGARPLPLRRRHGARQHTSRPQRQAPPSSTPHPRRSRSATPSPQSR